MYCDPCDFLPENYRKIYNAISSAVKNGKTDFSVSRSAVPEIIVETLSIFLLNNPEFFWLCSSVSMTTRALERYLEIETCPFDNIGYMRSELSYSVQKILSDPELVNCPSDAGRLKFIYKYIQENTAYDFDSVKKGANNVSHTVYGALVNKLSVCDGNAKAVILLCRHLNINAVGIKGFLNGVKHSWVLVQADGVWYHTDPTHIYTIGNTLDHSHWLQCDAEMIPEYSWDSALYPACTRENPYLDNNETANKKKPLFLRRKAYVTADDSDCVIVSGIAHLQDIFRKNITMASGELKLMFGSGFKCYDPKIASELFGKIAKNAHRSVCYTCEFFRDNRILIVRWE